MWSDEVSKPNSGHAALVAFSICPPNKVQLKETCSSDWYAGPQYLKNRSQVPLLYFNYKDPELSLLFGVEQYPPVARDLGRSVEDPNTETVCALQRRAWRELIDVPTVRMPMGFLNPCPICDQAREPLR